MYPNRRMEINYEGVVSPSNQDINSDEVMDKRDGGFQEEKI